MKRLTLRGNTSSLTSYGVIRAGGGLKNVKGLTLRGNTSSLTSYGVIRAGEGLKDVKGLTASVRTKRKKVSNRLPTGRRLRRTLAVMGRYKT